MATDREAHNGNVAAAEGGQAVVPSDSNGKAVVAQDEPPITATGQAFTFLHLLFRSNPTWLDIVLLVVGTFSAIAAGVPFPLVGVILGDMMDHLNDSTCAARDGGNAFAIEPLVNAAVIRLVIIAAAQFVLIYIYAVCWRLQSERLTHRLRDAYFRSVLAREPAFFDNRSAGEVSSRLSADCAAIQAGTSEKVGTVVGQISFFVTAFIVSFVRLPVLAGIMSSVLPVFLITSWLSGGYLAKFSGLVSDASATAASIASEALNNVSVVQAFGAGPRLEAKFAAHMASSRGAGIKKAITASFQAGSIYFISYCANSLAYWQGSRMIASSANSGGGTSVGQVFTVVFLVVDACIILGGIAPMMPIFAGASSAYLRLRKDMNQPSSIDGTSDSGHKLSYDTPGAVEFREVSFSYPSRPGQLALKNVDLQFPAGKHTAIVGLSGSGKSTVAALIGRLYDPLSGTITLDGHHVRSLNVGNLRSFISLVQQEAPLFDRSVLENIALGLVNSPLPSHEKFKVILNGPFLSQLVANGDKNVLELARARDPTLAELVELVQSAAELADASNFIDRFDNGYSTQVGVGGKLVSGGQRQRIALACALIRDPRVLVLDEATAALDSASERRIQAAVDRVAAAGGRTVISIAHRLSTIRNADCIVVMRDGEAVERGPYAELLAAGGAFAAMVNLQGVSSGDDRDSTISRASTCANEGEAPDADVKASGPAISIDEESPAPKSGNQGEKKEADEPTDLDAITPSSAVGKGVGWLIRPSLGWLVLGAVCAAIVGCSFSASGILVGNTLALLSPCVSSPEGVLQVGRLFGGLLFMMAWIELVANVGSWSSFGVLSENILYKTRVLALRALMSQTVEWHQSDGRNPATLLSIITKDGAALQGFSGSIIGTLLSILVNFLFAIILSHILAWKIALVCLAAVPILLGAGIMQFHAIARFDEKHEKAFARAVGITVEAVNSMKTVASLSLEQELISSYRRTLKAPRRDILVTSMYTNIWMSVAQSTGFFVNGLVYWWGSQLVMRGEYTQSQFFTVNIALLVSANLWGHTFALAPEISRAKTSASRILGIIELNPDRELSPPPSARGPGPASEKQKQPDVEAASNTPTSPSSPLLLPDGESRGVSIAFRDVCFAYPARQHVPILNEMTFTVAPGQFIGLVGPSGAGKSTILALMQRLYAPTSGTISIDGVDLSSPGGAAAFRDDVAVVPQDNALFDGTVRFNVGLGARPGHDASDAEIEAACRLANLHDTITNTLPDGYDTECGPNGSRLSGGQRQRLAIARALVRRPRLLLLDESTSALDAESEAALQEGLERVARGITVVAITHRLHTVQKADVILVVQGGRVAERGTHRELMERSESYRVNAMQQMLR
ncbi:hypothetical protein RB597_005187 [Gaeumannomyces tritici]